jgi:hypothetical protein
VHYAATMAKAIDKAWPKSCRARDDSAECAQVIGIRYAWLVFQGKAKLPPAAPGTGTVK